MPQIKIYKKMSNNAIVLLVTIVLSCTLLIFINYFTIKILSANRAYVNGESLYSKGQKDAVRHLISYLYNNDNKQWTLYKKEISVPKGDAIARITLTNDGSIAIIKNGLRAGRNNEKDLDDLIWIFRNFQSISFIKKAIVDWKQGDFYINQIDRIAYTIHKLNIQNNLSQNSKKDFLYKVAVISDKLTINEKSFSNTIGEGTRELKKYLIYTNIFFILIIISTVSIYYSKMIKKIELSKQETEDKNNNLIIVNQELDNLVYSISHDLRSPIASLMGLVEIIKSEKDSEQVTEYLDLMSNVLTRQDQFICDLINYVKNKKEAKIIKSINLSEIINDIIDQHKFRENASKIIFKKELLVESLTSDRLSVEIIIHNLLSNALKYSDKNKEEQYVLIRTFYFEEFCKIEIEDNGIGISEQNQKQIFEMFFGTDSNKGTGLGLYIVKEAINNINGSINVISELNIGSKFIVTIPLV